MRILFIARHFTYFRNFESVVRMMADRGHRVHLAAEREEALGGRELVDRLAASSPLITVGYVPPRTDERWFSIATVIRRSLDYFVRAYDPFVSDNPVWSARTSGNTQAIAASETEVYMGGHWTGFQDYGVKRPFLGSVNYSNGVPTSWDTQCTGDKMGVWGLLIQDGKLHAAGVFRYFGSDPQRGYARFSGTPSP